MEGSRTEKRMAQQRATLQPSQAWTRTTELGPAHYTRPLCQDKEGQQRKERGDSEMKNSLSLKDESRTEVWKIRMTRAARR